jgi:hypothetical protein
MSSGVGVGKRVAVVVVLEAGETEKQGGCAHGRALLLWGCDGCGRPTKAWLGAGKRVVAATRATATIIMYLDLLVCLLVSSAAAMRGGLAGWHFLVSVKSVCNV